MLSAGQAEEEDGSFRNIFDFASALLGEEMALLLESPEGVQVCVVTALNHPHLHLAQAQAFSRYMLGVTARAMGMSMGDVCVH